jgi:elongation factor 1-delta
LQQPKQKHLEMTVSGLLAESKEHSALYANYKSIYDGEAIYDLTQCGSKAGVSHAGGESHHSSLLDKVAHAKQIVSDALHGVHHKEKHSAGDASELATMRSEMDILREENKKLTETMNTVLSKMAKLELRMAVAASPTATSPKADKAEKADDDEEIDLFGSGSEEEDDEEAAKLKQQRLDTYNAKKSKKPALIAKSSILLDVKPWDDETDMVAMEAQVRLIVQDGLLWGAAKLVAVGYGIRKLQILCIVEDDKVSVDELQEKITEDLEELVQSVDIASFNKI